MIYDYTHEKIHSYIIHKVDFKQPHKEKEEEENRLQSSILVLEECIYIDINDNKLKD